MTYTIQVAVTEVNIMNYEVEANNRSEAEALAIIGDTVSEEFVKTEGVVNREVLD